jgi:hypothetical protein
MFIGVEGDWITFQVSKLALWWDKAKIKLIRGDIFKYRAEKNSVIYCYLFPKIMQRLYDEGHFEGCLVIALTFEIKDLEPDKIIKVANFQKELYVYDFKNNKK